MAPQTAFGKYLDPIKIYSDAERLWDFVLLLLLLFYTIKKAFITARALREHGLGREVASSIFGAAGGEKQVKQTDNVIAFILALIMTISLMRWGNVSLKFAFTSGILPFIAAFMVWAGAYGTVLGFTGTDKKPLAIGISAAVAAGVFISLRTAAGGDYEWMYVVFWFIGLLVVVGLFKGVEEKRDAAGSTGAAGTAIGASDKATSELLAELEKLKAKTTKESADEKEKTKELEGKLGAMEGRYKIGRKAFTFQTALASALLAAAALLPAPFTEVEAKLSREFEKPVVQATMRRLKEKVRPVRARPAAPARAVAQRPEEIDSVPVGSKLQVVSIRGNRREVTFLGIDADKNILVEEAGEKGIYPRNQLKRFSVIAPPEGAAPAAEVIEITDADKALRPDEAAGAQEVVEEVHEEIESEITDSEKHVREYGDIASLLNQASAKFLALLKVDEDLHTRVDKAKSDVDAFVQKIESSDQAPAFRERAEEAKAKAHRIAVELSAEAQSIGDALQKHFDVLHMDVSVFEDIPPKLQEKVNKLKEIDKKLWSGPDSAQALIAAGQYEPLIKEYGQTLAEIRGILKEHEGGADTVIATLPEIIKLLGEHQNKLEDWKKIMMMVEIDMRELQKGFAEAEKAEKEKKEAMAKAVVEFEEIKKDVKLLSSLMTSVFRPGLEKEGGPVLADQLGVLKQNTAQAIEILGKLDEEKEKIVRMSAQTKETSQLGELLETLKKLPLRRDLVEFKEMCDKVTGQSDEIISKALTEGWRDLLAVKIKGEEYDDAISNLLHSISNTANEAGKSLGPVVPVTSATA